MNEAETRAELIDPALKEAGWGVVDGSRVRREVITLGRLQGAGKRGKQDIADYVLFYRGQKLGVIEAKKRSLSDTEGVAQAKRYAERLQTRFTYSTNGVGIYQVDMQTGKEGHVERYPTPDELWAMTFGSSRSGQSDWRDRFGEVPFEDKGGFWQPRFYQHNAINRTLEAIADGKERILLTLATGTGKTAIAFQITWKLFHSRWSLLREPKRRPRILFLADRNILANQAYNSFSAFPEDALIRISPDEIRKKGSVPKNGSIFFTIFQTFMSGSDAEGNPVPNFGEYPEDFFDFIIIDECHRGGANDESNWRGILEYFSPAVQLGLTATPLRKHNADTYRYFGEPVYIYSLKDGINDGFLTPFKVKQIATTLDDYVYTSDDKIIEGEIEEGKIYEEKDFNRTIEIEERERYRVNLFMQQINQKEKTLVFCATQGHALLIRDIINQVKTSTDPNYCVRVTADDGSEGERFLKVFQDNEKTIPTILTTSQKLSTGVDARNIRNIVLMRPINSMIEFKQIVGRGTRLFDGKDYFTIYDFVEAYKHFNDREWDGEPLDPEPCSRCGKLPCECIKNPPTPCKVCGNLPCTCEKPGPEPCPKCGEYPCECEKRPKVKVKLSDGKARSIKDIMVTTFWGPDGKPMSATQFVEHLFGQLPELFKNEDELREIWSLPDTRQKLLEQLEEKGFGKTQFNEMKAIVDAKDSDVYDVLAFVAFAFPTITRVERVQVHKGNIFSHYDYKQQEFIDFVLAQYVKEGVDELAIDKLEELIDLRYHNINDAVAELGAPARIREVFVGFQKYLYQE
ncbi:MAG: DEAD/DEAH box helicase family protein [Candidatus Thiodiazotropha sp. (ex Semelilucina semeliformis)]|nr:DEAD/DEAH box helicase family protein [Candidatus Thiodiazotropha sp. (ex Semelilucina semeliformis)]